MDVVLTREEYLKRHPEETPDGKAKKRLIELVGALAAAKRQAYNPQEEDDDELTDEEYDNIYYGQVDETSDETYDGDNPYAYTCEYDAEIPQGFNSWPKAVKSAWRKKHKIGER